MPAMRQKFRCGSTEIELVLSNSAHAVQFVYVDDVLEAFDISKAKRFEVNGGTIPYMRDDGGIPYNPKRIPCHPDSVIQVLCETSQPTLTVSRSTAPSHETMTLSASVQRLSIRGNSNNLDASKPTAPTLSKSSTTHLQSQLKSLNAAVLATNQSGRELNAEAMQDLIAKHLTIPINSNKNTMEYKVDGLVRDMGDLKQQTRKMLQLQQQTLDRLTLIQNKTEAILTQQLELAEYPIPRLFIVLPEEPREYDPANWFRTKFRLYFICECGAHTEDTKSKGKHHLHIAKHEGYLIREPTKFFNKYGPFLLLMLEMIKFGTGIAGHVVPTLASLKVVELADSVRQSIETVTAQIDYSLECIDKQFAKVEGSSAQDFTTEDFTDTDSQSAMKRQYLIHYLNDVKGLQGVELRQLGSFLKTSTKDNLLGNLYRMTTSEGHVKWVCLDHYQTGYQESRDQKVREVVKHAQGEFDEQLGKITIALASGFMATEFYTAISKARGVLELDINLDWDCSKGDLEVLEKALRNTRVSALRLDIRRFEPSFGSRLLSTSSQFGVLFSFGDLPNMKTVHMVLPGNLANFFAFRPKTFSRSCKVSFELGTLWVKEKDLAILTEAIKSNLTLTILELQESGLGEKGALTVSEALKTNSTLTTLSLVRNNIGDKGAQAVSQALRNNSTLTLLNLQTNSIGDIGALALSLALKTNSTLTTLVLSANAIGPKGAQSLSEALNTNSTLTTLNLEHNKVGDDGARAFSEVLKVNSTLRGLNLAWNSISKSGTEALSEALKINTVLTDFNISYNLMEWQGAQTIISEFIKVNSTLTVLSLEGTSIGLNGVQVLSKALSSNSTLTRLNLGGTAIRSTGIIAIAEVFKTNATLTVVKLNYNSIGDVGAQAVAKAISHNFALTDLNLRENNIGNKGARALAEALKTNSTLAQLDLKDNSIGPETAQLLLQANSTCHVTCFRPESFSKYTTLPRLK